MFRLLLPQLRLMQSQRPNTQLRRLPMHFSDSYPKKAAGNQVRFDYSRC